jgi:hypothetical protein
MGREQQISYWRDKSGRELDFVLRRGGKRVDVIECKVRADRFDPEVLAYFRSLYPQGENWVATPYDDSGFTRRVRGLKVQFGGISQILSSRRENVETSSA